ncbi:unnamed protein product [Rhizophagus irregularis]|nr:unnamed protein product [Rhizophagus irregularis]
MEGFYFSLKSFFNFNEFTLEKIVRELKRQRDVNVHHNVIRFYGITKLNSENETDQSKNYFLVMEYADGVTCIPVIYWYIKIL